MKRKWLAIGIILLFISIAVAPSINQSIVKASNDDDLVEVTTQAYDIQGYGNTTVKLTKEQYNNLEQYLIEFRARLNQTSTREETIPLFKEAVVELEKYGLLPKGMSVEQAQKLITHSQLSSRIPLFHTGRPSLHRHQNDSLSNVACLIAGKTGLTCCLSLTFVLLEKVFNFLYYHNLFPNLLLPFAFFIIQFIWISNVNPLGLTNRIYLGFHNLYNPDDFHMFQDGSQQVENREQKG